MFNGAFQKRHILPLFWAPAPATLYGGVILHLAPSVGLRHSGGQAYLSLSFASKGLRVPIDGGI